MSKRRLVLLIGGGLFIALLAAAVGVYFLWLPHSSESINDPLVADIHRLEQETEIEPDFYFQNGFPRFVHVQVSAQGANSVERARNFLQEYQELYQQTDPALELHVRRVSGPNDEFVTFYQTYYGIEVIGSEMLVAMNGEKVNGTVGGMLPAGVVLDTYPLVGAVEATEIARDTIGKPDANVKGEATIMVYDPSLLADVLPEPHLVWRIPLGPGTTHLVYVDAHTGDVLLQSDLVSDGYYLDHEDGNGYSDADEDCYWNTTDDDWIGDETGLIEDYLYDNEAIHSWWHSKNAYYFFFTHYGRDSYDNAGDELELYIYTGAPNARWIGGTGCDLIEFRTGWVSWDVMIHEYTHGIQYHTTYLGMGGGYGHAFTLKESLSDIQGLLADPDDWTLGEDRTGVGGIVRDAANPGIAHMDNYDISNNESAGYANVGIPNKAAYLTAVGGHYITYLGPGLGRTDMGHLYYYVMLYLPPYGQFIDARNLAVLIATQWYTSELKICTVMNAWAAVGIGDGDIGCDGVLDPEVVDSDGDYVIDAKDNCPDDYNPKQDDWEHDGIGDVCDLDDDNDLYEDTVDNCPFHSNPDQSDVDGDGKGDRCEDEDGDTIIDILDNCVSVPNSNQVDSDEDGLGNACDDDLDGDGVNELGRGGMPLDNCPFEYNPDQLDSDGDGIGDVCDDCPNTADLVQAYTDVPDILSNMGVLPQPYQPDSDGDGIPDACDPGILLGRKPVGVSSASFLPDGTRHPVELHPPEPGKFMQIPIPVCTPEDGGWHKQTTRGMLVLEGVDPQIGTWLGNSAGFSEGKTRINGDQRIMQYQPQGGMNYYLLLGIPPDYQPEEAPAFSLSLDCIEIEEGDDTGEEVQPEEAPGQPPVISSTPTPTAEVGEEALPEAPAPEESYNRCDLFTGDYPLTTLEMSVGSTALTLFIKLQEGVPGLEVNIPEDTMPWQYSAKLGELVDEECTYQGYAGHLYCDFLLPESYFDTYRPLSIFVNGCEEPIYLNQRVTIYGPPEPEPTPTTESCSADFSRSDCTAAGGTYVCGAASCSCACP